MELYRVNYTFVKNKRLRSGSLVLEAASEEAAKVAAKAEFSKSSEQYCNVTGVSRYGYQGDLLAASSAPGNDRKR